MKFRNPFKKDPIKKEKTAIFKEVKAKTEQEIREIEKIADPAERVRRYEAVGKNLLGFYNEGKPETADIDTIAKGAIIGDLGVGALAITAGILVPHIGLPVMLGMIGSGIVGGGSLGAVIGSKDERKRLRDEFGSVANVRSIYKLQQSVKEKAEKDREVVSALERTAKLREHFDNTYNKTEVPPALVTQEDDLEKMSMKVRKPQPKLVKRNP